ncbi:MAG: hypothetical protein F6K04_26780 [Leptolyngbya sp. SIO4C5]|nr:hypothetical protein [Leptolyngbya sp. SIO4C5]
MDPVTLALMAAGLIFFGAMVFFFLRAKDAVENAKNYKNETERMNQVLEVNSRELANHKRELEEYKKKLEKFEASQQQSNTQQLNKEDAELENLQRKVSKLISEMNREKPKWRKELAVSQGILSISGVYSVGNAFTLINLILQSIVLGSYLARPEGAVGEVRQKSSDLETRSKELLEKIDSWLAKQEQTQPPPSNSVNVVVQTGEHMGSNYGNSINQYGLGDNVAGDKVRGDKIDTQINNSQDLVQASKAIKALLVQLSDDYPSDSPRVLGAKAVDHIEKNPELKSRILRGVRAGSFAALGKMVDHPVAKFFIEGAKETFKP